MKTGRYAWFLPLVAGGLLWSADFWEKKKFPDWSEKEAQKLLKDSPWARRVEVLMQKGGGGWGGGGRGGGKRGGGGGGGGMLDTGGFGAESSDMPGMRGGGGMQSQDRPPGLMVTVRWHSALPIKQAVAKLRFGAEVGTSPDAAKMLARQETHYVVGLAGLPPQLARVKPAELAARCLLKAKGGEPITAENLQGESDQGKLNLYLFFPRTRAFKVEDGDVELVVPLGRVEIKRKFRLKDMVYEGKLEI